MPSFISGLRRHSRTWPLGVLLVHLLAVACLACQSQRSSFDTAAAPTVSWLAFVLPFALLPTLLLVSRRRSVHALALLVPSLAVAAGTFRAGSSVGATIEVLGYPDWWKQSARSILFYSLMLAPYVALASRARRAASVRAVLAGARDTGVYSLVLAAIMGRGVLRSEFPGPTIALIAVALVTALVAITIAMRLAGLLTRAAGNDEESPWRYVERDAIAVELDVPSLDVASKGAPAEQRLQHRIAVPETGGAYRVGEDGWQDVLRVAGGPAGGVAFARRLRITSVLASIVLGGTVVAIALTSIEHPPASVMDSYAGHVDHWRRYRDVEVPGITLWTANVDGSDGLFLTGVDNHDRVLPLRELVNALRDQPLPWLTRFVGGTVVRCPHVLLERPLVVEGGETRRDWTPPVLAEDELSFSCGGDAYSETGDLMTIDLVTAHRVRGREPPRFGEPPRFLEVHHQGAGVMVPVLPVAMGSRGQ